MQREDIYKGFRFTPYATRRVLVWGLAVPVLTLYLLNDQSVSGFPCFDHHSC